MNSYAGPLRNASVAEIRTPTVLRLPEITKLLRRYLWLIVLCGLLAAAGGFIYAHTLPKTFTANALLAVEGERFAIPELQGALRNDSSPDPMPFVHTEVQVLTSRAMIAKVVDQLKLENNPEFNADLRPPTLIQQAKQLVGDTIARFLPQQPLTGPSSPTEAVVGNVLNAISVFQDNRSLVISVSFVSRSPELSARVVNLLIEDYIASRTDYRASANQSASMVMAHRVDQARADVDAIERQIQEARSKGDVVGLRAGTVGQQQVEELTTALATASSDRSKLEATYNRAIAAQRAGSVDALTAVLDSPTISRLRDEEAAASRNLAQLSSSYDSNYPLVRSARLQLDSDVRQISAEAGRIVTSLGAQLHAARDQEANLRAQMEQARHVGVQSENASASLAELQQEATTRRALYQTLATQSLQAVAQPPGNTLPDVRVLSAAVPPAFPSGPHTALAGLLGGAGGGLLGCLFAFTRLNGKRCFASIEELASVTGLAVLASVPRRMLQRPGAKTVLPAAADMERMRQLHHRLRFTGRNGVPRCVLFVPEIGDADPAMSPRLAETFARSVAAGGERVLLIEGDLRRPRLRAQGGSSAADTGINALFAGRDWRQCVVADQQSKLDLLLAPAPIDGGEARLTGVSFQNLLVEARIIYDLIVLSAPPADRSDAGALTQRADATILVVDQRIDQRVARESAALLTAASRTPVLAVLLQSR